MDFGDSVVSMILTSQNPSPSTLKLTPEESVSNRLSQTPRTIKIDLHPMVAPMAIRFARQDSARRESDLPDLASRRRASLAAARRLLNDELSASDAVLNAALDQMIDAVLGGRSRHER